MIPQRNLSLLSNRLAKDGGRRIPETVLERDYCLAWFLIALSKTPLRDQLAFKGGTALKRCYFGDYRFSEDLDFTLTADASFESIREGLEPVFAEAHQLGGVSIRFDHVDEQSHQNSHTFYLAYEGPLQATAKPKTVKVDITIKEQLVFPVESCKVLRAYEEFEDLPEDAEIRVYSLGEIAAEKVVALLDPARNEPRDLYDIWFLTSNGHVDLLDVVHAIDEKLKFRGRTRDNARAALEAKEARYKKLWGSRLSAQMTELPEFESLFREARRALREAGIVGK